ncbi:unnamed protein product [Spirodela intermedia]|uniref:DUF3700 domain-containing protein n=1 Tax=Spirodela intermedia TaxID=51605 RepID=A0A7I8K3N1_SPIIN|nr:unnamed protein product [Spirodela intermedia]
MLAVFEKAVAKPPEELNVSAGWMVPTTRFDIPEVFKAAWPQSTFYNFPNGNFMALSHATQNPFHDRSMVVVDDIFCIFMGIIDNIWELRRHYGLGRQATEPMLLVEMYRVLRERAPYPPDQMVRDLNGKFAFVLFDAKRGSLFAARDREGKVRMLWGISEDESLVFSDDGEIMMDVCGISSASFPAGCIFINAGEGLVHVDHPRHKVRGIRREDEDGMVNGVLFQVDMFTRLPSVPRVGSAANWGAAVSSPGGDEDGTP